MMVHPGNTNSLFLPESQSPSCAFSCASGSDYFCTSNHLRDQLLLKSTEDLQCPSREILAFCAACLSCPKFHQPCLGWQTTAALPKISFLEAIRVTFACTPSCRRSFREGPTSRRLAWLYTNCRGIRSGSGVVHISRTIWLRLTHAGAAAREQRQRMLQLVRAPGHRAWAR